MLFLTFSLLLVATNPKKILFTRGLIPLARGLLNREKYGLAFKEKSELLTHSSSSVLQRDSMDGLALWSHCVYSVQYGWAGGVDSLFL